MIGLLTRKMPSFEGVGAGQTATLRLPIGFTYHQLLLDFGATTDANIKSWYTAIRVLINGEIVQDYRGTAILDLFNKFEGRAGSANHGGLMVLDFERYGVRMRDSQMITAVKTGNVVDGGMYTVSTFTVEIDISPAATAPVLSALAVQSPAAAPSLIKIVRRFTRNPSGGGEFEISDLPTKGNLINKIVIRKTGGAGTIDKVKLQKDNFDAFERTAAQNAMIQADGVRVPQPDVYVIDPTEDGNGSEGIITFGVSDFRLILTMSDAADLEIYVEYISVPGAFASN